MRYTLVGYLISETNKSIWRSKMSSFLSCATTGLALFLLGIAILINLNLGYLFTVVQNEMEIQAYFAMDATDVDITAAVETAREIEGITEVDYVSRDEALLELKDMFQDKATILDGIENPLPASVRIKTGHPDDVPAVVAALKEIAVVDDVIYDDVASRNLASLGRVSQILSLGGTVVVGLVAITVIGNSTRMTIEARRHEVGIMKLVGATDGFVIGPFVLTGMILGAFGGLIGTGLCVGLYTWLTGRLGSVLPFIPMLSLGTDAALNIAGILVITGAIVGILGSVLSLRRHLNV
ncbi:MAG: cell division protein FtsX [Bacillota bacterium]